jgi:hypothetical protein
MYSYGSRTIILICTKLLHVYAFREGRDFRNVNIPKRVRVPMRVVPVARKIRIVEERHQERSYLFRRTGYRNEEGYSPENCPGFESMLFVV